MKVIDLLNKIANGEEVPKEIRIDHWCYKFKWVEHDSNYYDKHEDIDLMSCLSMSEEELNYEVHELKEDKKIEKLEGIYRLYGLDNEMEKDSLVAWQKANNKILENKINEIIDKLEENN